MTIYRIGNEIRRRLIAEPESGMRFQVLKNGLVVFNASFAIPIEELRSRRFTEDDYSFLSGNPDESGMSLERLYQIQDYSLAFSLLDRSIPSDNFGLSFPEAVVEPSEAVIPSGMPFSYYRFSAYSRDLRVNSRTGDFEPKTYATTLADMHFVPSGFAAVGRYALSNPASARFVFSIVTYDRPDLMGTTTPNFGQAGGGVEVLFWRAQGTNLVAAFGLRLAEADCADCNLALAA